MFSLLTYIEVLLLINTGRTEKELGIRLKDLQSFVRARNDQMEEKLKWKFKYLLICETFQNCLSYTRMWVVERWTYSKFELKFRLWNFGETIGSQTENFSADKTDNFPPTKDK